MPHSIKYVEQTEPLGQDLGLPLVQRVALVRSHSAARITWHSHPFYELLILSDGATTYEFKGGQTADLAGGQFLIIPPECIHRGQNDLRKPTSLCGLMIAPSIANAAVNSPFSNVELAWLKERLDRAALKPLKMSPELRSLVKTLPSKISSFAPGSTQTVLRTRLSMCQILLEVAAHLDSPTAMPPSTIVERAIQFMQQNLDNPTSIVQVAKSVGCSRARLFEIFREATGLAPNDYWQRIRVEEAYRRLLGTSDSITSIALACGFSTSQYFCTVFRKYWGISPTECRKGYQIVESRYRLSRVTQAK